MNWNDEITGSLEEGLSVLTRCRLELKLMDDSDSKRALETLLMSVQNEFLCIEYYNDNITGKAESYSHG